MSEKMYMHKDTGSVDTREGWIESYTKDELEERGVSEDDAFSADVDETLIEVVKDDNGDWVEAE